MTANAFTEDHRQACFDAGMNDFIAKPEALYETLEHWLEQVGTLSPAGTRAPGQEGMANTRLH